MRICERKWRNLALLWDFIIIDILAAMRHRVGGGCATALRMAWRIAGRVGCGGGLEIIFPLVGLFQPLELQEGKGDHAHEAVSVKPLPPAECDDCPS